MTTLLLVGIAGNLQRPSRTLTLVSEVVSAVCRLTGGETLVFDVVEAGPELGSIRSPRELCGLTQKIVRSIEQADLLVVGSGRSHGKTGPDQVACAGRGLGYKLCMPLTYPTILLSSAESTSE
jgi:hypothetical protein